MKYKKVVSAALFALMGIGFVRFSAAQAKPHFYMLDAKVLSDRKSKIAEPTFKPAAAKLERAAQRYLTLDFHTVMAKTVAPPSGDKHDYTSQSPYFWKNPDTKDGLPYIRRDGERNPEDKDIPDHDNLDQMIGGVETLAAAYYFTGKEEYAVKATEVLRKWFIDTDTKMNPNLNYAQFVPGQSTGRNFGIIETRGLIRVIDSIALLQGSKAWKSDDQAAVTGWFAKFLDWLLTSKNGKGESQAKNNHGTHYDFQVAAYALFTGKPELARKTIEAVKTERIAKQIEPDGSQPLELARTRSWSYSTMNLQGMISLARIGDLVGVDLWNFKTSDGRSIRKAIDFLYPFAGGGQKWTYKQIDEFAPEKLYTLMRIAADKYKDAAYKKMMSGVPQVKADDKNILLSF